MADATPATPAPVVTPEQRARASDILASRKASLGAIDPASVGRPRVGAKRALELTAQVEALGTTLATDGTPFVKDHYAVVLALVKSGLMDGALAYYAAESALDEAWTDADEARFEALKLAVHAQDARLTEHGRPFFAKHATEATAFAEIAAGHGVKDDVKDVLRHVAMWRRNAALVAGHSVITAAYLDQAEADATELAALIVRLEQRPKQDSPATLLWRQAYHAWAADMEKVTRVGRFFADKASDWPGISHARVAKGVGGKTT